MMRQPVLAAIAMCIIVLASTCWPGDAQLLDDEPNLLHHALVYNSTPSHFVGMPLPFTVAPRGLLGTRGVDYGPLPTWIYQIFLLLTHNPIAMVSLRALLVNAVTAIALTWLARTMKVSPWLAAIAMLSPWLWLYSRQLWDNSFCIPLSALALAAYADFLAKHRGWALALAFLCALAGLLIHLMTLALVVPLALHFLICQTKEIRRFKWLLLAIILIFVAIGFPYIRYLASATHPTVANNASLWKGWIYPFFGAHHLSAAGMEDVLGPGWFYTTGPAAYVLTLGREISLLAFPIVWLGMILALLRADNVLANRFSPAFLDQLSLLAMMILISQCILDGLTRAYDFPHYFNATWIIFAFFAFLASQFLWHHLRQRSILAHIALPAYAAALIFMIATTTLTIHRNGGTRNLLYGTTLADQKSAYEQIAKYSSDIQPIILIEQWQKYPGDLKLFAELDPQLPSGLLPRQKLIVRYRDAFPSDAHLFVEVRPL